MNDKMIKNYKFLLIFNVAIFIFYLLYCYKGFSSIYYLIDLEKMKIKDLFYIANLLWMAGLVFILQSIILLFNFIKIIKRNEFDKFK